jgi:hypothetical protein
VSFLPPQQMQPDSEDPQEQQAPGEEQDQHENVNDVVDACLRAIRHAAETSATSDDPAAQKDAGSSGFFFAQAVEKLMPQKPNPDVALKAQAQMIQHGAQMGQKDAQHQDKLQADMARAEAAKASAEQANMNQAKDGQQGATDGNNHNRQG